MDATAPIPLDLSDWGDATPPASEAAQPASATRADPDAATDAHERRNAASS